MPGPQYSIEHLDALARSRGFQDYATWQAWNAHRTAALTNQGPQAQQAPTNWFQTLINKIPIHPAHIFNYIADALGKAGEQP